ncbi:MAG: hypothetical protein KDK36_18670 [Leptospiraceae bacterium]|nr:hypothetical protein [Leptospiraceae bacterium]
MNLKSYTKWAKDNLLIFCQNAFPDHTKVFWKFEEAVLENDILLVYVFAEGKIEHSSLKFCFDTNYDEPVMFKCYYLKDEGKEKDWKLWFEGTSIDPMNDTKATLTPDGAPSGKYHPGQIYEFFFNKSKDVLLKKLGEPDERLVEDGSECWLYRQLTYDYDNPSEISDQKFLFDEDGIVNYDYCPE